MCIKNYEINFPTIENPYYFQLTSKKHIFLYFSIFFFLVKMRNAMSTVFHNKF